MSDMLTVIAMIASLGAAGDHVNRQQARCLAENVYYESRGEPIMGQAAVAWVTLNRAKLDGMTICQTVHARFQFSWTNDAGDVVRDIRAWDRAVEVSVFSMVGYINDPTNGSTHYFNPYKANPAWQFAYQYIGKLGNHVFYRDNNRGGRIEQIASIDTLIRRLSRQ